MNALALMCKSSTVIVLLLGLICFANCKQSSTDVHSSTRNDLKVEGQENVEYAVYSALIEEMYVNEKVELVVIKDHTKLNPLLRNLSDELERVRLKMPTVSQETLSDFQEKNKKSYPIERAFKLSLPYVLFGEKEDKEIFQDAQSWRDFYKRYPDSQGLITLSKVGFDSGMSQALVYVGNQQAGLGGAGYYVLLSKKNDTWSIQERYGAWIS
jgi:hypothetical protein